MSPIIDDTVHEFRVAGLYNGLALMEDMQTRSYWDHVTGESIHGPLRSTQLDRVMPLRYLPASSALERYPNAHIALSRPTMRQRILHRVFLRRMLKDEGHLPFMFGASMQEDDPRRPRMELGLGIWWPGISRFYPVSLLRAQGGAVLDTLGERRILVFIDPDSNAPLACTTEAQRFERDGRRLVLDNGEVIQGLERIDDKGAKHPIDMLPQLFTRWYGFVATFPGCEVYEGS